MTTLKISGLLLALAIAGAFQPAAARNCDVDDDGRTDATCGGPDRDLDNDGRTDAEFGGPDREVSRP